MDKDRDKGKKLLIDDSQQPKEVELTPEEEYKIEKELKEQGII